MNGKMNWMGAGGAPWEQDWKGANGSEEEPKTREFCRSLRPIEISRRYQAIEPEEEDNDYESDSEPGMLIPADPDSTADRLCPCGGLRNYDQDHCDCGIGIFWPVEKGERLDGARRPTQYVPR